jgi:ParB family chromosome partitioning protein
MSKALPKLPGRERQAARVTRAPSAVFGALAESGRLRTVAIEAIAPNPKQPRRRFDEAKLQWLAESIAARGVLQPPTVRATDVDGQWELVAGERRLRAAKLAGLVELEVLVKDVDAAGSLEDALLENVARENLSPVEEAHAYVLIIEDLGVTREELGRRIGVSRATISNHLRLLDLPDEALDLLDQGELTFAHGRALLMCDDHETRRALAVRAAAEGWSTRELEAAARAAGAPRTRRPRAAPSTDQLAFAQRFGEALSHASGVDLSVRGTADDKYTITVEGIDNARTLATRLAGDKFNADL